eukprot:scaffold652002_cov37-Prasinocladus_malaysianus.AAC.2
MPAGGMLLLPWQSVVMLAVGKKGEGDMCVGSFSTSASTFELLPTRIHSASLYLPKPTLLRVLEFVRYAIFPLCVCISAIKHVDIVPGLTMTDPQLRRTRMVV